jgi:hypothetical protein
VQTSPKHRKNEQTNKQKTDANDAKPAPSERYMNRSNFPDPPSTIGAACEKLVATGAKLKIEKTVQTMQFTHHPIFQTLTPAKRQIPLALPSANIPLNTGKG